ncbi:signal recognition particle-docking protein FtsY [Pyrofollis japonicus]|uniref:signal recognition particle-docking protein FtsY n=1 Tax=Pyrofollis japonicus TaxID=3060460 RepID=UPI00295B6DA3|nr:signal recognition particle-docking protein FtsY [Pyrofollis japonicus]BEP18074.1 signal recognition particle-docking protein FtsY [Pyrofollis japonicus]
MVFNRIKKAFKKFVDTVSETVATKEVKEEDIEPIIDELIISLVESDVALEVAEEIANKLKKRLVGTRVPRLKDVREYVISALAETIKEIVSRNYKPIDLIVEAKTRQPSNPLRILFFGVNGVGKTTTIAKFAYMFKKNSITPVIAAADTYRAGAQEQLRMHAEKLNVPFIGGRYGADPASVVYDAIEYARARGYRVVLADTAGRMHTDRDLMEELRKITKVAKPDYKVLVVDALTGNDAVDQARFFEEAVGIDFVVLTKVDADVKGGTALTIAATIDKPILYLGVGQRYEDLEPFDPERYVKKLLEGIS